jgi:membrane protein YdbS with pleckstrin-like domain
LFQNPEIPLDELPVADDVAWEKLHARFAHRIRLQMLITLGGIAILISALNLVPNIPLTPFVVLYTLLAIVSIVALLWPGLSVPRRGFVLRDKDILFRKGVVWQSVTAVPFNRVQHVETSSSPLDRKFGLANLQIFTAGGSGGDLKISGLGEDTAEQLRIYLLGKVGASIENH